MLGTDGACMVGDLVSVSHRQAWAPLGGNESSPGIWAVPCTRLSSMMKAVMMSPLPSGDGDNVRDDDSEKRIAPASPMLANDACVPGTGTLHILTPHCKRHYQGP